MGSKTVLQLFVSKFIYGYRCMNFLNKLRSFIYRCRAYVY